MEIFYDVRQAAEVVVVEAMQVGITEAARAEVADLCSERERHGLGGSRGSNYGGGATASTG